MDALTTQNDYCSTSKGRSLTELIQDWLREAQGEAQLPQSLRTPKGQSTLEVLLNSRKMTKSSLSAGNINRLQQVKKSIIRHLEFITAWCIYEGTSLEAGAHDSEQSTSWAPTVDKALRHTRDTRSQQPPLKTRYWNTRGLTQSQPHKLVPHSSPVQGWMYLCCRVLTKRHLQDSPRAADQAQREVGRGTKTLLWNRCRVEAGSKLQEPGNSRDLVCKRHAGLRTSNREGERALSWVFLNSCSSFCPAHPLVATCSFLHSNLKKKGNTFGTVSTETVTVRLEIGKDKLLPAISPWFSFD